MAEAHPVAGAAPAGIPTIIYSNQVTIAAAAAPLVANPLLVRSVTIEAPNTNAGPVWVGGAAVAVGAGFALRAGASVSFDFRDLNNIYVVGTVGDVVTYLAVN